MTTFVDTSALFALLAADDARHQEASRAWRHLIENGTPLVSTSYVLVETFALVQRRLGMQAVRALDRDIVPVLQIIWIDAERHRQAAAANSTADQRDLSLVDCASFVVMRELGLDKAFAFDRHFVDQGFSLLVE